MLEIFFATKNLELSTYLLCIIEKIAPNQYVQVARAKEADLVIADTETIKPAEVKELAASSPIILYCNKVKPLLLNYTRILDVNGVFSLSMTLTDLEQTLSAAQSGDIYYNEGMIGMLFSNTANETIDKVQQLTSREKEIIELMKSDFTNEGAFLACFTLMTS